MESCLAGIPERIGPVEVDDIRKDLLREFTALPVQVCLILYLLSNGTCDHKIRGLCVGSVQQDVLSQSENLQVYLRVRPMTVAERKNGEAQV